MKLLFTKKFFLCLSGFILLFALAKYVSPTPEFTIEQFKQWYPRFYYPIHLVYLNFIPLVICVCAFVLGGLKLYIHAKYKIDNRHYIVLLFSVASTLFLVEMVLWAMGYKAGERYSNQWFSKVNTLQLKTGFSDGKDSIFHVDTAAYFSYIKNGNYLMDDELVFSQNDSLVVEVFNLPYVGKEMLNGKTKGALANIYNQIKNKKEEHTELEQAIFIYAHQQINSEGFRSIEFNPNYKAKKKVLLLGDSFTWGHSANDITNSFADILLSQNYAIYNTGISGTDPAQYLQIARKYIPTVKPDIVVVNLFLGNDAIYYHRDISKGIPLFYATNAGNLNSFYNGHYFTTAASAYANTLSQSYIASTTNNFNKFCAQTRIGTLLWKLTNKFLPFITYDKSTALPILPPLPYPAANDELKEIQKICTENNCQFIISIIPEYKDGRLTTVADYKNLLTGMPYYAPTLTLDDYKLSDGHFNNAGHKNYATYLQHLIDSIAPVK